MLRIIVVCADWRFRKAMKAAITQQRDMVVVDAYSRAHRLPQRLEQDLPDVLVFDAGEHAEAGVHAVQQIRSRGFSRLPVLFLSTAPDDEFVGSLASKGIDYYLVQPVSMDVLVERIRQVSKTHKRDVHHQEPLRQKVCESLAQYFALIGIPDHLNGYGYLMDAVALVSVDSNWLLNITKRLYAVVGETYGVSPTQVERSMRHAIEVAWDRGELGELHRLFPHAVSPDRGKPTNSQFIAQMADIINFKVEA